MSEKLEEGREMRAEDKDLWTLLMEGFDIVGFEDEGDDDGGDDDADDDDTRGEDDSSEDDDDDDDDADDKESKDGKKAKTPDLDGLKSALRKERIARKQLEREIKQLKNKSATKPTPKKTDKGDEGKEDKDERPSAEAEAERRKSERLAKSLRDRAIDNAILRFTGDFRDPDDVVKLLNRSEIDVDQDDDDPSEIVVDMESVEDAVKAFAKKKKHLLKSSEEGGSKSGSKFGGRQKKNNQPSEEQLRAKYSALRR